jgi:rhamnogalacturonyl hydrolase YesR
MKPSFAVLLGCLALSACASHPPSSPDAETIGNKVADWQLAHMDRFDYVRTFRDQTEEPASWIQAAFYIGLARWADTTRNSGYAAAVLDKARQNDWRPGPLYWHADDQAIAQVYLKLAGSGHARRLQPVVAAFDRVLANPPRNSLEFDRGDAGQSEGTCQRRWCWCDALFMAPPAWAALSNLTGDAKYRDYALREYFATRDYLYDDESHLFYRDSRFFDRRSESGNKIFWSRGNGWVFAGLPLLLEALPPEHGSRGDLLLLYREMAAALKDVQHADGYWAPSLLDVAHQTSPETSGTAFITFGLAWGVNRNLLPAADYADAVEKGWTAITAVVADDGKPGWVQQVGNAPDEVRAGDTQLYGSGAILLAASEMLDRQR